jgi:hypothetical protein
VSEAAIETEATPSKDDSKKTDTLQDEETESSENSVSETAQQEG